jgi:hypothetical protein
MSEHTLKAKRAKDLVALDKSIQHWKENSEAEYPSRASVDGYDCALCALYNTRERKSSCLGCPIFVETGRRWCGGTPYDAASTAYRTWSHGHIFLCEIGGVTVGEDQENAAKFRTAAIKEMQFLVGLRDKLKGPHNEVQEADGAV